MESEISPASESFQTRSHSAPAPRASSSDTSSPVPLQTSSSVSGFARRTNSAVACRLRNEPSSTVWAWAQARNARVPLVVVATMDMPATFSRENSRGELPRSKSTPPVCAACILKPSRSPASSTDSALRTPHSALLTASASEISLTGMISFAPFASAVTNVLVARRMSNTTHAVCRRSRRASVGNSVGDRMVSNFIFCRSEREGGEFHKPANHVGAKCEFKRINLHAKLFRQSCLGHIYQRLEPTQYNSCRLCMHHKDGQSLSRSCCLSQSGQMVTS